MDESRISQPHLANEASTSTDVGTGEAPTNAASPNRRRRQPRHRIAATAGAFALSGILAASPPLGSVALAAGTEATESSQSSQSQAQSGQPGEPPSGAQGGAAPDAGSAPDASSQDMPSDLPDGASAAQGGQPGQGGPGGGADTQTFDYGGTYSGAFVADGSEQSSDSQDLSATEADQNAVLAQNGGTASVTGGTISKTGDDTDGDTCNFYGANSGVLAVGDGSQATLDGTSVATDAEGANALFATDSGTVWAHDVTIDTGKDNSRGLDATYGGTVIGSGLDITTRGDHCATLATDRGGGTISATDSRFSTAGSGSPLLYSTGTIEVDGVTGTATGSQIAGMEGLNTILVSNSDLTSTLAGATASDPVADGVIIYQSTSGDADTSSGDAARFQATDSTLTSGIESGAMFYVTNTNANVVLQNTTLDFDSDAADLLLVAGNDSNNWGSAGSNGATLNFTGIDQALDGDIEVDTTSQLGLYLLDSTTYTGAISITKNEAGSTVDEPVTVNVSGDSTWVVTGDSTVSNLNVEDGGQVVDSQGRTVTIVAGSVDGQTVVEGDSDVTVTVEGSYGTSFETSEANEVQAASADRSGFDVRFSQVANVGQADGAAQGTAGDTRSLFQRFVGWLKGLFV